MIVKNIKNLLIGKQDKSNDVSKIHVSNVEEMLEPDDYFKKIKETTKYLDSKDIENIKANIDFQIKKAQNFEQTKLVDYLTRTLNFFSMYQTVINKGFNRYILFNDINKYIKRVVINDSIKFIELERYMRIIPDHVIEKYNIAKESNLFNRFYVLFTDYTHMENETVSNEEKRIMERNRDPILFGQLTINDGEKSICDIHDNRLFIIEEWEDKNCSLTFDQVIEGLRKRKLIDSDSYKKGEIIYDK